MAKRNRFQQLPPEDRAFVERRQFDKGFGDIDGLQDDLKQRGHDIPRSTCGEINKFLKEKTAQLQQKTSDMTALVNAMGDKAHNLGLANVALLQNESQEILGKLNLGQIDFNEIDDEQKLKIFYNLSKVNHDSARAAQTLQSAKIELEKRVKETAQAVEETVKKAGLSDETATFIRQKILGIA